MGDDGLGRVDRVQQVPDHPIRRQRLLVGGQPGHPIRDPSRVEVADPAGNSLPCLCLGEGATRQFIEQCPEHELRIAHNGMLDFEILVQVVRVEGGVDEGLALRHLETEGGGGEAAPDPEDHIGVVQKPANGEGCRPSRRTEGQRVRLVEGALTPQAGGYRSIQ